MYNHELRLERARNHLQRLKSESRRWLRPRPYRVYAELDAERRNKLIKVEVFEDPPAELGLIIGECLHNMRAALDNLVYDLARAHRGIPLSKSIARDSQFPIFKDRDQFMRTGINQIRGVAPVCKTIIKGLQPYHRGEKFAYHRLWMLRELSNADKHRVLHPTLLMPRTVSYFEGEFDMSGVILTQGPVENGTEIARYPFSGEADAEVNVDALFGLDIGFGQESPLPILPKDIQDTMAPAEVLQRIHDTITWRVVSPLRLFLRRKPPRSSIVKE